ncbi:MAG TPA: ABC transporter permease [Chloroflexia bacterium]
MSATIHVEKRPTSMAASQQAIIWHRFRRHRRGVIALLVLALITLGVIFVPIFSPFQYYTIADGSLWLAPPGASNEYGQVHWLGTDFLGRDLFTRLFFGGRISLLVAFCAAAIVVLIGTVVGSIAGFYGGWIDTILMRVTDFMLALPLLPMFVLVIRFLRTSLIPLTIAPRGTPLTGNRPPEDETFTIVASMVLVFVIFGWMGIARLVRGSILSLRESTFVEASVALGAGHRRLIFKHLIPNSIAPILVAATFALGDFIIWEAVLSYMGQGIAEAFIPTWGNLLAISQDYIWHLGTLNPFEDIAGYMLLFPTFMILVTVLALNYIGEALRDAFDPHGRV